MTAAGLGRLRRGAPGDFSEQAGTDAAASLVARRTVPTAVFAANDLVAVGAIDALERNGHDVPKDVSVVGFDNTFFARLGHVSLTTVDQPREQMGRFALELLVARMRSRRKASELVLTEPTPGRARNDGRSAMRWWLAAVLAARARWRAATTARQPDTRPVAIRAWGCAADRRSRHRGRRRRGPRPHGRARAAQRRAASASTAVEGAVVAVDRRLDAALIAVTTTGSAVAMAADVAVGPATIEGRPVFVRQLVTADVEEPRDATRYLRQALVVEAESRRGDSGAAVVAPDGSLLGMVFASSTRDPGVTYAVSAVRVGAVRRRRQSRPTSRCHCPVFDERSAASTSRAAKDRDGPARARSPARSPRSVLAGGRDSQRRR